MLEIGSGSGRNTKNLIAYARMRSGVLFAIDPSPQFDVFEWRMEYADTLRFFEETSLDALAHIEGLFDAVLIDGDHNWYTVFHELQKLDSRIAPSDTFPLTILHDVGWPYARRDQYCDPDAVPYTFRQPYDKKGIVPGQNDLLSGHGMNPAHWNAASEHSIRNGVLTAVEDFLLQSKRNFLWTPIPGFFGLGILVDKALLEKKPLLRSFLLQLELPDVVRRHVQSLEEERIKLAIEVAEVHREEESSRQVSSAVQQELENMLKQEKAARRIQEQSLEQLRNEKSLLLARFGDVERELALSRFVRDSLGKEMKLLESDLHRVWHSRSWKLTRFLRVLEPKIRRLLRREKHASAVVPAIAPVVQTTKKMTFCTIVSRNFLAYARVLASSLHVQHPDAELIVLLVDDLGEGFSGLNETFTIVPVCDIPLPDRDSFCFRYGMRELHTAVKPFFLQWIFENRSADQIVYLDPDILVEAPLFSVQTALASHSIVLTPHVLTPIQDGLRPSEHDVLRVGVFNLGFIGLSRNSVTLDFLHWWQRKVTDDCTEEPNRNVFFDQRWMDLAPVIFPDVTVLRDASCNVAYWNLHERNVAWQDKRWMVNGSPLTFYHFSGFRPDTPDRMCKYDHSDRSLEKYPALQPLLQQYADALQRHGWNDTKNIPYLFARFRSGMHIPAFARRHFHMLSFHQRMRFGNPFATGVGSYVEWLHSEHTRTNSGFPLSNAHSLLWKGSMVLSRQFPHFGDQFAEWLHSSERRSVFPDVPEEFFSSLKRIRKIHSTLSVHEIFMRRNSFRWYRFCTECARRLLPRSFFMLVRSHFSMRDLLPRSQRKKVCVPRPAGINVVGSFTSGTGVGQASRLHVLAAEKAGIPLTLHNLESPFEDRVQTALQSRFTSEYTYGTTLLHMNADRLASFLRAEDPSVLTCYRSIAYWVWELSRFPRQYRFAAKWFDEIWTPSRFSADAIAFCVDCPVHVIPHPVYVSEGQQFGREHFGIGKDAFVFLFVFNCQSVAERKNPEAVIEAFKNAFSPDENVQLVLKFSNAKENPLLHARLSEHAHGHNILFLSSFFTNQQVDDLLRCSDAYVSLHRSEGFGLTIAEAMFLGKPVIATNYSGNAEYMTEANSMPIGYKLIPLSKHYPPYRKGNVWADPDISEAAAAMRRLFDDRSFASALGARAAVDMRKTHSPEVIGKLMKERLFR